ncbi:metallophosphoesterase family protein [Sphingomonas colocasiae]|uniref:Serine/threonine protein phosphatase n=1 Tax=Sphingomonas colocasiae TaxID=1848973 RepID=A0ABS7PHV3_9SPHN|nr:metallophosphoesterase family protein [Sphingomonas colocasiae]MBY8820868.1 serine/threonine protein phosphatase [Sphingomonas colocasiae]
MLYSRLKRWTRRRKAEPVARVPDGLRIYAIGDIHGRLDLFEALLARIDADNADRPPADVRLILLGDLIDRGPSSRGVIEKAMALKRASTAVRILMGNHEEVFLRAIEGDARATRLLIRVGGRATMLSYGFTDQEYQDLDFDALTARLAEHVPAAHVAFIAGFEDMIEYGDYLFVHAGIRPGVDLAEQSVSDLRWIRDEFLRHDGSHGRIIVHGHSISDDVDQRPNRIGIDTGAFASGRLTAIALEGAERWFLQTGDMATVAA